MNFEQQVVYNLMMMPVAKIPPFPPNKEAMEVGEQIKKLYDNGTFQKMTLDSNGIVHCI